jgi:DNA-binding response OmpR family regulator
VLVVDDDERVRRLVLTTLRREGFDVIEAVDGAGALSAVTDQPPDVLLLDLALPGLDGLDVLRSLREATTIPIIVLTGRATEADRVLGLDLGADDYVVKPFLPRELAARVRAVARRAGANATPEPIVRFDDLVIDRSAREVFRGDEPVELTAREFDLLLHLASSPRTVFSREQLLRDVWESSSSWQDPDTVTEHVRRLRRKLEADPSRPEMLVTVRGVGYRFDPPGP